MAASKPDDGNSNTHCQRIHHEIAQAGVAARDQQLRKLDGAGKDDQEAGEQQISSGVAQAEGQASPGVKCFKA